MRWFHKVTPKDPWDDADLEAPLGDLEAANRIRAICNAASSSAQQMRGRAGKLENKRDQRETERYERAAKIAMAMAMKISDDLVRDAAVGQIVRLCMTADNLKTAEILVRAIQSEGIREQVFAEHPALRR